jgi:hypothetical protein
MKSCLMQAWPGFPQTILEHSCLNTYNTAWKRKNHWISYWSNQPDPTVIWPAHTAFIPAKLSILEAARVTG